MIPLFQPSPTNQQKVMKNCLLEAFNLIIMNASDADFARLRDAIGCLQNSERVLWRSLRACHLIRAIFDLVDAEEQFRNGEEQPGAA